MRAFGLDNIDVLCAIIWPPSYPLADSVPAREAAHLDRARKVAAPVTYRDVCHVDALLTDAKRHPIIPPPIPKGTKRHER
jgi:hypothetical protein